MNFIDLLTLIEYTARSEHESPMMYQSFKSNHVFTSSIGSSLFSLFM